MNNDLKYALNGILLALLFFGAVKFISFVLSIRQPERQEVINKIDWAMSQLQTASNDPKFEKGEQLFAGNCAACHRLNSMDAMPLADIETRIPDKMLLYSWIRNSGEVIKSGNKYFTDMYNSYNKTAMPLFLNFTDEDIDAILFYIKIKSTLLKVPVLTVKATNIPANDNAISHTGNSK